MCFLKTIALSGWLNACNLWSQTVAAWMCDCYREHARKTCCLLQAFVPK